MINPIEILGYAPEKVEMGSTTVFEKRDPVYNSLLLGVPVKYILLGIIVYKIFKK